MMVTVDMMIKEAERELRLRRRVYPRWVDAGRMTKVTADKQVEIMEAIVVELRKLAPQQGLKL